MLSTFLAEADLSPLDTPKAVAFWLDHGCVYVDGQRQRTDIQLSPEQIVRLHTNPKFYPRNFVKLSERIVSNEKDFIVLNKPEGLPSHATLDNFKENAKFLLEEELGHPVYTTSRLDIPTSGLLLLGKTAEAQAAINKLFAKGRVTKRYLARTKKRLEPGHYVHFMDREGHVPRAMSSEPVPGWWECSMDIEKVEDLDGSYAHTIRLRTGRTHQIRSQMAYMEAPIIGDSLYGSNEFHTVGIALSCTELSFLLNGQPYSFKLVD